MPYPLRIVALLGLLLAATSGSAGAEAGAGARDAPPESAARVIMYHRFGEGALPSTSIRIDQLEAHIDILTSGPYAVLPLDTVARALRAGEPLPPRTVAITIDDAYDSFITEGWPRFKAAGLPVTWFINTQAVDGGYAGAPSWDEVRRLRDEGVAFGVHMHAHPSMPALSPAEQAADLAESLARLDAELGVRPAVFAYPYGEADAAALALVAEAGFVVGFGQHSGVAWGGDDLFYLPRFSLNERFGDPERFRRVVEALPLPAVDVSPQSYTLRPADDANPPLYGFTVTDPGLDLDALACYGPGGALEVEHLGTRVEVRMAAPLPVGRVRINCTLPGPRAEDGTVRWHWRGLQVLVTAEDVAQGPAFR